MVLATFICESIASGVTEVLPLTAPASPPDGIVSRVLRPPGALSAIPVSPPWRSLPGEQDIRRAMTAVGITRIFILELHGRARRVQATAELDHGPARKGGVPVLPSSPPAGGVRASGNMSAAACKMM